MTLDVETTGLVSLEEAMRPDIAAMGVVADVVRPDRRKIALVGAASDLVAVLVATVLASLVVTAATGAGTRRMLSTGEGLVVCLPVLMAALTPSRRRLLRRLSTSVAQELRDVTLPLAAGTLLCIAGWRLLAQVTSLAAPSEDALLSICTLTIVCVALARRMSHTFTGQGVRRVIVVGTGQVAERVATRLAANGGVTVLGFVDDDPKEPVDWLGPLRDLSSVCHRLAVDHVVVAFSRSSAEDVVDALRPLQGKLPISVVPRLFDVTHSSADTYDLVAGYPALSMAPPAGSQWQGAVKRAIDIAAGVLGLILTAPVMLVAMIGVALSSSGPVVMRQVRVGRNGREFTIWKFRTFTVTESVPPPEVLASGELVTGPFLKLKNDPRTTAFGRVLRRTSIDELPQLLNVVGGTMSLVGPRPLPPEFAWDFGQWALRRYEVKPGLTGLWQVSGRNDLTYEEMCRLDDLYATNWSLGLDLRILARTGRAVVSGHGCY